MDRYQLQKMIESQPEAKLKDLVMQLLYDEIISLKMAPGTKLNVNQIASILGISRTPVAEAIAGLTESGFVVNRSEQAGSYVLELSLPDMISLYQVRNAIESEAAYLCAYNADDGTIRELTRLSDAFRDSVTMHDIRGMRDTDMPFHQMIIDACAAVGQARRRHRRVHRPARWRAPQGERPRLRHRLRHERAREAPRAPR